MVGVSISEPSYIYGGSMSAIHNNQRPKSTLSKNSNLICYHKMIEGISMGEPLMAHILKNNNPLDLMMKVLARKKRQNVVGKILYDIYDEHQ